MWHFLSIFILLNLTVYGIDSADAQETWYLGANLTAGDYVVYEICDGTTKLFDDCYTVRLDFVASLESDLQDLWVIQAEINTHDDTIQQIFFADIRTLQLDSYHYTGSKYAVSVQDTVLYLGKFAHYSSAQSLAVGAVWGTIPSVLDVGTDLIVAHHDTHYIGEYEIPVSVVQYGLFEQSRFLISSDIPLPISGIMYDPYWPTSEPPVRFAFELVEYYTHG